MRAAPCLTALTMLAATGCAREPRDPARVAASRPDANRQPVVRPALPSVTSWAYDGSTLVFRQSLATHYEAPFMVLLIGASKALLVDTGTGDANVRAVVDVALADKDVELVVAHSHSHGDHIGGDAQFAHRPRTAIVGHSPEEIRRVFGISNVNPGSLDLGGGRVVRS